MEISETLDPVFLPKKYSDKINKKLQLKQMCSFNTILLIGIIQLIGYLPINQKKLTL